MTHGKVKGVEGVRVHRCAQASWAFGALGSYGGEANGTKMVQKLGVLAVSLLIRGLQKEYAQSIIGATLNRREGSGRVVCGVKAVSKGILVYAFLYHLPGF